MSEPIIRREVLERQLATAMTFMDRDDAVQHVAGLTGVDPVALEGVLASQESRQAAAEAA